MIIGIGTDIVNIARIEKILSKHSTRFLNRLFTSQEQQVLEKYTHPKRRISAIAKRFAAKEAIAKAFGTGISQEVRFHDMEITHDSRGKPLVILSERAQNYLASLRPSGILKTIDLSISDDYPWAQAFVIIAAYQEERTY